MSSKQGWRYDALPPLVARVDVQMLIRALMYRIATAEAIERTLDESPLSR